MISAESGKVFDDNTIDQTGLHLIHHLLKSRAIEIQPGASVVDLNATKLNVLRPVEIVHDNAQLDTERIARFLLYAL